MKKTIILIVAAIMILSFAACGSPAVQQNSTQQTETASPTLAPTAQPTKAPAPTPEPLPTPEPTLSPEEVAQQQATEKAEEFKYYYETYGDFSALVEIYKMYFDGMIGPEIMFEAIGVEDEYKETFDLNQFMPTEELEYQLGYFQKWKQVINGRGEDFPDYYVNENVHEMIELIEGGLIYISRYDTKESRDRIENGIKIMREYFADPSEENLMKTERMCFSEENLPGEIILYFYLFQRYPETLETITRNGKEYSNTDYCKLEIEPYGLSWIELMAKSAAMLVEQNQTPNPDDYEPED